MQQCAARHLTGISQAADELSALPLNQRELGTNGIDEAAVPLVASCLEDLADALTVDFDRIHHAAFARLPRLRDKPSQHAAIGPSNCVRGAIKSPAPFHRDSPYSGKCSASSSWR